jgi:hypothetical protein
MYGVKGSPRVSNPLGVDRWCHPCGAECLRHSGQNPPPDQVGGWLGRRGGVEDDAKGAAATTNMATGGA